MHRLRDLMEDDVHVVLAQQIFLYLPPVDMLECKYVCKAWNAQMQRLLRNDWTQWSRPEVTQKMTATMDLFEESHVVQELHLSKKYKEIRKKGFGLRRCSMFRGFVLLQFVKPEQDSNRRKYWFCATPQNNIHNVHYATEFAGTHGDYYTCNNANESIVIWWYTLESDDLLQLNFIVLDVSTSLGENTYTSTMHKSDFVSPVVALHELTSGDDSLRSEIKMQFPEHNHHAAYIHHGSLHYYYSNLGIFFCTRPPHDLTEFWFLNTTTMSIEVKQTTRMSDWICTSKGTPVVRLKSYRNRIATFYIKTSRSFAVWDLSRPGHPRHISFDMQLPTEPWECVIMYMNRANSIIVIYSSHAANYFYVDFPSPHIWKNASVSCECPVQGTQACRLEETRLTMRARKSSHNQRSFPYFIGDRFVIHRPSESEEVYVLDTWKQRGLLQRAYFKIRDLWSRGLANWRVYQDRYLRFVLGSDLAHAIAIGAFVGGFLGIFAAVIDHRCRCRCQLSLASHLFNGWMLRLTRVGSRMQRYLQHYCVKRAL